jgi:uncharacterized protein involved in cysteine biosynthesis
MPFVMGIIGFVLGKLIFRLLAAVGVAIIIVDQVQSAFDRLQAYILDVLNLLPSTYQPLLASLQITTALSIIFTAYASVITIRGSMIAFGVKK